MGAYTWGTTDVDGWQGALKTVDSRLNQLILTTSTKDLDINGSEDNQVPITGKGRNYLSAAAKSSPSGNKP
jgi:hypothetical protein